MTDNYESVKDRMVKKYLIDKVHLFRYSPCIIPGWEAIIDKAIAVVEQWNEENQDTKVKFFQVKKKWAELVIYLEPYDEKCTGEVPKDIRIKISNIAQGASKFCVYCGKEKIETVKETRIVLECFEHWDRNSKFY
jgi:hypothetical protein